MSADPIGALNRRIARLEVIIQDTTDLPSISNDLTQLKCALDDFIGASSTLGPWIASARVQQYIHRPELPTRTQQSTSQLQMEDKINLVLVAKDQISQFAKDLQSLQLNIDALQPYKQQALESSTNHSAQVWQLRKHVVDITVELHYLSQWSLALCQYWHQLISAWNSKCADWEDRMNKAQKQIFRIEHSTSHK